MSQNANDEGFTVEPIRDEKCTKCGIILEYDDDGYVCEDCLND